MRGDIEPSALWARCNARRIEHGLSYRALADLWRCTPYHVNELAHGRGAPARVLLSAEGWLERSERAGTLCYWCHGVGVEIRECATCCATGRT